MSWVERALLVLGPIRDALFAYLALHDRVMLQEAFPSLLLVPVSEMRLLAPRFLRDHAVALGSASLYRWAHRGGAGYRNQLTAAARASHARAAARTGNEALLRVVLYYARSVCLTKAQQASVLADLARAPRDTSAAALLFLRRFSGGEAPKEAAKRMFRAGCATPSAHPGTLAPFVDSLRIEWRDVAATVTKDNERYYEFTRARVESQGVVRDNRFMGVVTAKAFEARAGRVLRVIASTERGDQSISGKLHHYTLSALESGFVFLLPFLSLPVENSSWYTRSALSGGADMVRAWHALIFPPRPLAVAELFNGVFHRRGGTLKPRGDAMLALDAYSACTGTDGHAAARAYMKRCYG